MTYNHNALQARLLREKADEANDHGDPERVARYNKMAEDYERRAAVDNLALLNAAEEQPEKAQLLTTWVSAKLGYPDPEKRKAMQGNKIVAYLRERLGDTDVVALAAELNDATYWLNTMLRLPRSERVAYLKLAGMKAEEK